MAFESVATNLDGGDTDSLIDIYVKDLTSGDLTLVSTSDGGAKGNSDSAGPSISSDGTKAAFVSNATNLDPGDTDSAGDVYMKDLATGDLTLVSTSDGGVKGNSGSFDPAISSDGTRVAFHSLATNLDPADTDSRIDIYVKDLATGDITLVSTSDGGVKGNSDGFAPSTSSDGTKVAFWSFATNLDAGDSDASADLYVKDLATGNLTLASTSDTGVKGNSTSAVAAISSDGTKVAFASEATNLDPSDADSFLDIYVKDLATGNVELASTSDTGAKGNSGSAGSSISSDGAKVAFDSAATNLDPADTDFFSDVYVKELGGGPPAGSADLSLDKSDSRDPVAVGGRLNYRLAVRNFGPDAATGVTLTDQLPADVTFVSAQSRQGACTHAGGVVTCNLGTVASGARARVTIRVRPTAAGVITNTADVTANESDPIPANNHDSETTTVQ